MRYRRTRNRSREAEQVLNRAFDRVKNAESVPPTSMAHLRTRVEAQLADRSRETSIMARFIRSLGAHPKLSAGVVTVVAFLLFTVLVPLPYTSVIGYSLNITAPADTELGPQQYAEALSAVGVANPSVNLSISGESAEYSVTGLTAEPQVHAALVAYEALTGQEPVYAMEPIKTRSSGTLYAQAMEKIFTVEISTEGKTDEEIVAEIAAQIAAQGGEVREVKMERTEDGQMQFEIEIDSKE